MMKNKVCGVYKITNTVTGDFYIGSSKNVNVRWASHKWSSTWKANPNNRLYQDMQKYGVENFMFQIVALLMPKCLKQAEQEFIETLKPTYNNYNANGQNVDRRKETMKEYEKYDKCKEYRKEYRNQLCSYNGETLTLNTLSARFLRAGIEHPTVEAKKYLKTTN